MQNEASSYNGKDIKTMFQGTTIAKYVDSDFTGLQQKGSQMKLEIKTIFVFEIKRYCISLEQRKKIEAKRCTSFFAYIKKKAKRNSKNIYCDIKFVPKW